jgi:hypothetical protein
VSEGTAESAATALLRQKPARLKLTGAAIKMHEDAVRLLDRLHQTEKSRAARERAERAREMLRNALAGAGRGRRRFVAASLWRSRSPYFGARSPNR